MKHQATNAITFQKELLFRRTKIGLEICPSLFPVENQCINKEVVYRDDFFLIGKHAYNTLIMWNKNQSGRKSLKNQSGVHKSLFIPLANPQPIRLTSRSERLSYFNFGELYRFHILRYLPKYPFKPHQKTGVEWLQARKSAILADDMGLGKTLQAIAAIDNLLKQQKIQNVIIVCPKSLIGVWESELELWAPHLCKVTVTVSIDRKQWNTISKQTHVAITNYETMRHSRPGSEDFELLLFDEIHKLKNYRSLNYKSLINLKPDILWGLSGTPLENTTSELISILHLLDQNHISMSDVKLGSVSVRKLASKYILRRSKNVIEDELPDVLEKVEYVPLTEEQKAAYNMTLSKSSCVKLVEWISTFNHLRQICDYDPTTLRSSKIDRAIEIVDAILRLNEKIVVFSYLVKPLEILRDDIVKKVDVSKKSDLVTILSGTSTLEERKETIEQFQKNNFPKVLLCTTRALAEGVTLTRANHVLFLNEWWNPSVNAQARDRVHRIGQKNSVMVHKLRTTRTIESRLEEILETKSSLFSEIVSRLTEPDRISSAKTPSAYLNLFEPITSDADT